MVDQDKKIFTNPQNDGQSYSGSATDSNISPQTVNNNGNKLDKLKDSSIASADNFSINFQDLVGEPKLANKTEKNEDTVKYPNQQTDKEIKLATAPKLDLGFSSVASTFAETHTQKKVTDSQKLNVTEHIVSPNLVIGVHKVAEPDKTEATPVVPVNTSKLDSVETKIQPITTVVSNITSDIDVPMEAKDPKFMDTKKVVTETKPSVKKEKTSIIEGSLDLDAMIAKFDTKQEEKKTSVPVSDAVSKKIEVPAKIVSSNNEKVYTVAPVIAKVASTLEKKPDLPVVDIDVNLLEKDLDRELELAGAGLKPQEGKQSTQAQKLVANQLQGGNNAPSKRVKKFKLSVSTMALIGLFMISGIVAYFMYPEEIAGILGGGDDNSVEQMIVYEDNQGTDIVHKASVNTVEPSTGGVDNGALMVPVDVNDLLESMQGEIVLSEDVVLDANAVDTTQAVLDQIESVYEEKLGYPSDNPVEEAFEPFQDIENLIDSQDQKQQDMIAMLNFYVSKSNYYIELGGEIDNQDMVKYASYVNKKASGFVQDIKDTNEFDAEKMDKYINNFNRYMEKLDEMEIDVQKEALLVETETQTGEILTGEVVNTGGAFTGV